MRSGGHLRLVDASYVVRNVWIVRHTLIEYPLELGQTLVLVSLLNHVRVHKRHLDSDLRQIVNVLVPITELRVTSLFHVVVVHVRLYIGKARCMRVLVIRDLDDVITILALHGLAHFTNFQRKCGVFELLDHLSATKEVQVPTVGLASGIG